MNPGISNMRLNISMDFTRKTDFYFDFDKFGEQKYNNGVLQGKAIVYYESV